MTYLYRDHLGHEDLLRVRRASGAVQANGANGNLLSDGTRMLTWDAENRLSSVKQGGPTIQYRCDVRGNLTRQTDARGTALGYAYGWEKLSRVFVE